MAANQKNRDARSSMPTRKTRDITNDPALRDPSSSAAHPLSPWRSWTDQMERFFNSWGLGAAGNRIGDWNLWNPQLETFLRGDELVLRVDLPGMSKDDVNVEVTDDRVIIQGERKHESTDDTEGFYRSERSYGSFYRAIPLPEGAITDDAKANFKDGVLEITMPAPPKEARRGRRIEIGSRNTAD